mmetsp:Transcript_77203/g.154756  ORF Transcript_77203/g.154756 Transcript_77203/m.154756 type:complete len:264 (-) Transcript_77203:148-939(-)
MAYRLNESWSGGADNLVQVRALLESGASVNTSDQDGRTLLFVVARENELNLVTTLLNHGANVNQARTDDGNTPLIIAAQHCHLPVVQLLLDRGANVNQARTDDGATPLFTAAYKDHLPVVQLLLDRGADVAVVFAIGTAREVAFSAGHAAVAQLIAASEEARALASQGNEEIFRAQIMAAEMRAPFAQWVPVLPAAARTRLVAWARALVQDARSCYMVLFADLVPQAPVNVWRDHVDQRLMKSFLVLHNVGARRLLRELAKMG